MADGSAATLVRIASAVWTPIEMPCGHSTCQRDSRLPRPSPSLWRLQGARCHAAHSLANITLRPDPRPPRPLPTVGAVRADGGCWRATLSTGSRCTLRPDLRTHRPWMPQVAGRHREQQHKRGTSSSDHRIIATVESRRDDPQRGNIPTYLVRSRRRRKLSYAARSRVAALGNPRPPWLPPPLEAVRFG